MVFIDTIFFGVLFFFFIYYITFYIVLIYHIIKEEWFCENRLPVWREKLRLKIKKWRYTNLNDNEDNNLNDNEDNNLNDNEDNNLNENANEIIRQIDLNIEPNNTNR
jgi:hypothetical protein